MSNSLFFSGVFLFFDIKSTLSIVLGISLFGNRFFSIIWIYLDFLLVSTKFLFGVSANEVLDIELVFLFSIMEENDLTSNT